MNEDILQRLITLIPRVIPFVPEITRKIREDADFIHDLGTESLEMFSLRLAIEDNFGITLPDYSIIRIKTVGEAARLIEFCMKNDPSLLEKAVKNFSIRQGVRFDDALQLLQQGAPSCLGAEVAGKSPKTEPKGPQRGL